MVFASGGRSETTANQCEKKRQEKRCAVNGIQLKSPHISTLPTHCLHRYHGNFVQELLRSYMTLPDHRAFDFLHQFSGRTRANSPAAIPVSEVP